MTGPGAGEIAGDTGRPVTRTGITAYDWLRGNAAIAPTAAAVTVCGTGQCDDERYSFTELLALADRTAAGMRAHGVGRGDRVVLSLPNDVSFLAVTFGCLALGVIAVPGPVPEVNRVSAFEERITSIVDDCSPRLTITTRQWASRVREAVHCPEDVAVLPWETLDATAELLEATAVPPVDQHARPADVALLQYTSGSTKRPRGVVITHGALRACCRQAAAAYLETRADVAVTWVPLYHDMGLITGVMRPMYSGYETVLLRPEAFIRTPASWLKAIDRHRGTMSSAPNFGYDLCVRKVGHDVMNALDLRTWRVARNAGEVVRAETVDRFAAHFAAAGFRPDAMCPSYGLAEATLTVTSSRPGQRPLRISVDSADLAPGCQVSPIPPGDRTSRRGGSVPGTLIQSCGAPVADTRVYIDGGTAEGYVGRICVEGSQVATGYWTECQDSDPPERPAGRLVTNDLGFVYQGQLFVLGRIDDTLVRHGRNFYAADVAAVCGRVAGVHPGRVAAFTTRPADEPDDQVIVVAELRADADTTAQALARRQRHLVTELARSLGLYVGRAAFMPTHALPVTTSGKVRTAEVRRRFEDGSLPLLPGSC
ncbi:MAG: AMP-binding protein [Streptosporangiaceae bacterium]|nr:AMP-binding protein [Streptosporangiaceae bacterium]